MMLLVLFVCVSLVLLEWHKLAFASMTARRFLSHFWLHFAAVLYEGEAEREIRCAFYLL